jgi:hypothetical protein
VVGALGRNAGGHSLGLNPAVCPIPHRPDDGPFALRPGSSSAQSSLDAREPALEARDPGLEDADVGVDPRRSGRALRPLWATGADLAMVNDEGDTGAHGAA